MNVHELSQPFPKQVLGQVEKGGRKLTYVPVSEVIARLNAVLGVDGWSFEIVSQQILEDTVVTHARLRVGEVVKEANGGQPIKRYPAKNRKGEPHPNAGQPLDLGDEFKGSASDALKKAAQQLGVGLDLARSEDALAYEAAEHAPTDCPEGCEGVTLPKPEMRTHMVDVHGWSWAPDGVHILRPKDAEPGVTHPTPAPPAQPCSFCGEAPCVCPDEEAA